MATASILSLRNGLSPVTGASRDDLIVGDIVSVESATLGFLTYKWELLFVPEGSVAALSPAGGVTGPGPLTFVVDKEGPYLVRLQATDGTGTTVQYVRLRALTAYGNLALVAAGEKYGPTPVPSDATTVGWAYEQNLNLLKLLTLVQSTVGTSQKAGENISKGDALALYWDVPNSEMRVVKSKADSPSYDLRDVYAIAGATTPLGGLVPVNINLGTVVQANFDTVLSASDFGKLVFLSTTAGLLTIIPPAPPNQDVFRVGILTGLSGGFGMFAFHPNL